MQIPASGDTMGSSGRAGSLASGSSSAEHLDAFLEDVHLNLWAVRAEKLIATLDTRQDGTRAEAECPSPARLTLHCQDQAWGMCHYDTLPGGAQWITPSRLHAHCPIASLNSPISEDLKQ